MSERRILREGGETEICVLDDGPSLVRRVTEAFVERANEAVNERGRFDVALSGGSTPAELYRSLARVRPGPPWEHTHVWFGDERYVPPTHPDSNYRMAHETLLGPLGLSDERVHRVETELEPEVAATRYDDELRAAFPAGVPHFDLVLLGIGEDGHCASLFPDTAALDERMRLVVANWVPKLAMHRITITFPVLEAAHAVWVLAVGERKASILREVLDGPADPRRLPVQAARPKHGQLVWWVDAAAAAELLK
jgi:6-phosphogluconolactonase